MLAECLIVHEQVHNLVILSRSLEPCKILLACQRPVSPCPVRETESDVVTERRVLEKELKARSHRAAIHVIRALPAEHMLCAFRKHSLESHVIDHLAYGVRIDKLSIAESLRRNSEIMLYRSLVLHHLMLELRLGNQ